MVRVAVANANPKTIVGIRFSQQKLNPPLNRLVVSIIPRTIHNF